MAIKKWQQLRQSRPIKHRKILLTGASGFLGKSIYSACCKSHEVIRLGRHDNDEIKGDITEPIASLPQFDMVIHAAGKAHSIPRNESEIETFHTVNTTGTESLLHALEINPPKTFVFISTVAVYGLDNGENISEDWPLNGDTPYAQSKIKAENAVKIWCARHHVNAVILRLPLITGVNPPGNLGSMTKALKRGYYLRIGAGEARKSVVGAGSVADFIPQLLLHTGTFNLTDGIHPKIADIENRLASQLNIRIKKLPIKPLGWAAKIGDVLPFFPLNSIRLAKLTSTLTFNDNKARAELGWNPTPALDELIVAK